MILRVWWQWNILILNLIKIIIKCVKSFNELTEKTFCFNFENWYSNGFGWDKFIPHSLIDRDKIIAHMSVSLMDFDLDSTEKHYIQIGTVMTHKDYRGQDLIPRRRLYIIYFRIWFRKYRK